MDSKNLIWLSSFFTLLFITFCVTRHLDDLNPNIISMPRESQEISAELAAVDLDNDIHNSFAAKIETPRLVKEKTELFTSDEMKKTLNKKESLHINKKPIKKEKMPSVKKIKKPKIIITRTKKAKQKTSTGKSYTIGGINIDDTAMQAIVNHQNNNELNKLAYMHSINKNSTIQISTNDPTSARSLKNYLQKQNIKKQDIKIFMNENIDNLIKITLIGRK